jgi:hypothetical protein
VVSGLIYAGRAGGRRTTGKLSTNTLWGRIATMHLAGNREFSTYRLTLAAVLHQAGEPVDDDAALSAWMKRHLTVVMLRLPADEVSPRSSACSSSPTLRSICVTCQRLRCVNG